MSLAAVEVWIPLQSGWKRSETVLEVMKKVLCGWELVTSLPVVSPLRLKDCVLFQWYVEWYTDTISA